MKATSNLLRRFSVFLQHKSSKTKMRFLAAAFVPSFLIYNYMNNEKIVSTTVQLDQKALNYSGANSIQKQQESSISNKNLLLCKDKLRKRFEGQLVPQANHTKLIIGDSPDDEIEFEKYSKDPSSWHNGLKPSAILYPTELQDVVDLAKICNECKIALVASTSCTSLEGHTLCIKPSVIVNFKYMNQIKKIYKDDLQVVVQPGIGWMDLNDELQKHDLFFPVDPGPGAGIGGMVATSCSGTNAVRYGTMKDYVVNLTVVLADGRVIKTGRRAKKSSAGYNLNGMFVGSEGTLGLVTEATLKVVPLPKNESIVSVSFDKISEATNAVIALIQNNVNVRCVELMDDEMVKAVNKASHTNFEEKHLLLFKFQGSENEVKEIVDKTFSIVKDFNGKNAYWAKSSEEAKRLWYARKCSFWATMKLIPQGRIWPTDVCVPISRLADSIVETRKDIDRCGVRATIVGHVGDGNYHVVFVFTDEDRKTQAICEQINERMIKRALEMDGTCTGEHGVGKGKREFVVAEKGKECVRIMRQLKQILDPNQILNPGKVFFETEVEEDAMLKEKGLIPPKGIY